MKNHVQFPGNRPRRRTEQALPVFHLAKDPQGIMDYRQSQLPFFKARPGAATKMCAADQGIRSYY
jgi:hypothetical protein